MELEGGLLWACTGILALGHSDPTKPLTSCPFWTVEQLVDRGLIQGRGSDPDCTEVTD